MINLIHGALPLNTQNIESVPNQELVLEIVLYYEKKKKLAPSLIIDICNTTNSRLKVT